MGQTEKIKGYFRRLAENGYGHVSLQRVSPVTGGSINSCVRLETDKGWFFLKENDAQKFPGMFAAEAKGLQLLAGTKTFVVPHVIAQWEERDSSFLLMEWMEHSRSGNSYEAGTQLAKLHRHTEKFFGLGHDNYIGSLPQSNKKHSSWEDFFSLERILPQVKLARDSGKTDKTISAQAENFCARIAEIFPPGQPSLLHGDLWSGNFFFTGKGPAVFDPAVYYGHREMDLAMTKLFGGFDADFYAGYANEFPPEKNHAQRADYCNLYPLLVHVNLFGGGYLYDVKSILKNF
ncbi:MAG TPA: fructosamine kinase family protein [Bacteroidia bacterium]|nr:fructosamine kinase family protein [Bacteroidia bacterium]